MPEEELETDMDPLESDIKKLTDKVDRVLEETERKFARCPKCDLPTHLGQDRRRAYCANCNMHYEVQEKKKGGKKLSKRNRKTSFKVKVATGVISVIAIFLVISLAFFFFQMEKEPGYIDIHDVNDIRKLPKAEDIPMERMTTHELELYIQRSIDNDTREEIRMDEVVYKFLFIIPDYWDLLDIYENESTGAGIAGMYDTEEEKMYIIGESSSMNYVNSILSHEYTHALQDQNFDLDSIYPTDTHDGDLSMLCAIEGDAMRTMDQWEDRNLNDWEKIALDIEGLMQAMSMLDLDGDYYSSPVLTELTYFPYTDGLEFVKKVYSEGGFDAVNDLFTDRPVLSTEQVLHFEKYMEYEMPMDVSFRGNTTGLDLQFTTTIGEKILSEVIYSNVIGGGEDYALGWGGDTFYHYTSGGEYLDILVTRWDTEGDNARFAADYENVLDYNGYKWDDLYNIGGDHAFMESSGDTTTIYMSSSRELLEAQM